MSTSTKTKKKIDASAIYEATRGCVRGHYQRHLLEGSESWSGSSLKGKAQNYGARYADSRAAFLARIQAAVADLGATADSELVKCDDGRNRRRLLIRALDGRVIFTLGK